MSIIHENKRPLFFIHIPKTAGTSFRVGAENYFETTRILKDYNSNSPETSPLVQKLAYGNNDSYRLNLEILKANTAFITGHVNGHKYLPVATAVRTVTLLREPLKRIVSEYHHFVRHKNYKKSFADFYRTPTFINKQSKMLNNLPLSLIGVVGLTKEYSSFLNLINKTYDVDIPLLEENKSPESTNYSELLTNKTQSEILELNSLDVQLYEQAQTLWKIRQQLINKNLPFTRGEISHIKPQFVSGWAYQDDYDKPVNLSVYINNIKIAETATNHFRPYLAAFGVSRGGYVGFHFSGLRIKQDDNVKVLVQETGQELFKANNLD